MKKLHPDHVRYLLVVLNLVLTGFMVWCGLFAFGFGPALWAARISESGWRRITGIEPVKDLAQYTIPETQRKAQVGNIPARIADTFEPPPPPPPPVAVETEEVPTEEEIMEAGPLTDTWEISSAALMPDPSTSCVWIAEQSKLPAGRRAGLSNARSRFTTTTRTRTSTSSASARLRALSAQKQMLLHLYHETRNPNPKEISEDLWVYLLDIRRAPTAIVYRVDGDEKSYLLKKDSKDGDPLTIQPEEDEDKKPPSARSKLGKKDPALEGKIKVGAKTLGKEEEDEETASASTAAKTPSSGIRSSARGPRPAPPSKKDVRDLKDVMKKIPAMDRKKLSDAMKGISKGSSRAKGGRRSR